MLGFVLLHLPFMTIAAVGIFVLLVVDARAAQHMKAVPVPIRSRVERKRF